MGGEDDGSYEFDNNEDLDKAWSRVLEQYEKITKQKLDPHISFEGLQIEIDRQLRDSKSKNNTNARQIMRSVGQCLQKFGTIVSQGAGVVCGPSAQCWNAISVFISVAQGYDDILNGFVTLMERSLAFLQRLNTFLEQNIDGKGSILPKGLRGPAYKILSHFLDILKSSYKLATSTRQKWKVIARVVLFDEDGGVAESLTEMERLVQDFTHVEVDQILVDVKGLARHLLKSDEEKQSYMSEIREHLEDLNRRNEQILNFEIQVKATLDVHITQEKHKNNLESIKKGLSLQDTKESWRKQHDKIRHSRVKNSGKWLERADVGFTRWADVRKHELKVLTLRGDSGFGKTYAFSHVIEYLQTKHLDTASDRAYVAYYYFGDEKDKSLETCLASIIYQFACNDFTYAKAVAKVCEQPASISQASNRWDNLVPKLQHAMNGTYFICIDGYDDLARTEDADETIAKITRFAILPSKGLSLRFFISGTDDALLNLPKDKELVRNIFLGPYRSIEGRMVRVSDGDDDKSSLPPFINSGDLEAFAEARKKKICKKKPDLRAILNDANIKRLVANAHGHYGNLEAKMIQIDTCDTEQRVLDIINTTGNDMDAFLRNNVKTLNSSLNTEQIEQLNEMLIWILGTKGSCSVELLQSALYFKFRKRFLIETMVSSSFSAIITMDGYGGVKLISDELVEILSEKRSTVSAFTTPGSATDITDAEIDLCKRFVKNMCGDVHFERFRFESFFNDLAGKQNIHVKQKDALEVTMTRYCMDILCNLEEDEGLDILRVYSRTQFYKHLKGFVEQIEFFEADRRSLADIGYRLVELLCKPELIDAWFAESALPVLRSDWTVEDEYLDSLLRFLKNPHAAQGYSTDIEKENWAKTVTSETKGRYFVLEKVAERLAFHWFSCQSLTSPSYFYISYGIVMKGKKKNFKPFDPISTEDLKEFFEWATKHTGLDPCSPLWSFRMGTTYKVTGHHEEALAAFEHAESQMKDNWALLLSIAEVHDNLKNHTSRLKYIHRLKPLKGQLMNVDKIYTNNCWKRIFLAEGNCHVQCKEYALAAECFRDILEQEVDIESRPEDVYIVAFENLLKAWDEMKAYDSTIEFLRSRQEYNGVNRSLYYWLARTVECWDMHSCIATATKHLNVAEEVGAMYQKAIDAFPGKVLSTSFKEHLVFHQGAIALYSSASEKDHNKGLRIWQDMVKRSDESSILYWTVRETVRRLAPNLLTKATVKHPGLDPQKPIGSHLSMLKALAEMDCQIIRDCLQSTLDIRLCLSRLYFLVGKIDEAHEEVKVRMRSIFDDWPENPYDESLRTRYWNLATTLGVLNYDDDAIAAWQITKPPKRQKVNAAEASVSGIIQTAEVISEQSATNPVSESLNKSGTRADDSAEDPLQSYVVDFGCDACGFDWSKRLTDCWLCKHCLDTQLCHGCYGKLQDGTLKPTLCNKEHSHLYIPSFDQTLWKSLPSDMMMVGGQPIARKEWIDKLRTDWGVRQEQIDQFKSQMATKRLKAAKCIVLNMLRWSRKTKKGYKDGPSI
ncbi:hypothetical protein BS50DRAFT_514386 [Corynespora cassiicola Philippines]|uniref:Uncharacterized protein n=1 Tax=Corynespora cassiicola Philippines TaxID=1448308 RepID=A0A2T2P6A8_CORCC|nr:hypothetical protein BS50DRAFT_514386 [Corynespora cassiicola Philippines]